MIFLGGEFFSILHKKKFERKSLANSLIMKKNQQKMRKKSSSRLPKT
jgi:hypothetical protein